MPAIELARLKQQIADLGEHFHQPDRFTRALRELFELYGDRTYRPGEWGEPPPLLPAFNIPAPLHKQVLLGLRPLLAAEPEPALALCDALWSQPYYEFRLLAAEFLSTIDPRQAEQILNRIQAWLSTDPEERIANSILGAGLIQVRQEPLILSPIEAWLSSSNMKNQKTGLLALKTLAASAKFDNLPLIFRLATPFIRIAAPGLRQDLLDLIAKLAQRAEVETAYWLRQNLEAPDNPDTAWIVRQSLPAFLPKTQNSLREALRKS